MNQEKLIELGLKKKAGELKGTSWNDIGAPFGLDGEAARQIVKKYCRKNGLLKGKYEAGRLKILIISDLHVPDHKREMILQIIKENAHVDLIILNGDILDCKAVSAWYNEEISILDHEMIEAHALLTKIRQLTKAKIVLVKGNHEQRVNRYYAQNAKAMGTSVIETEILYKLANGFTVRYADKKRKDEIRNVFKPIENVEYCESRSYMIGDLLVNHPSIFRKDYMKTVFIMWNERLKTKYPNAKVIVIGHTHQLGMVHADDGRVLIECGCTCNPASYADQDDRPFKVQQYGYVYLEMKDGVTDLDSIDARYLGHDVLPFEDDIEDTI